MFQSKTFGQRRQLAVWNFAAHQPPCERDCVNNFVGKSWSTISLERRLNEPHVESSIVSHDYGVAYEFDKIVEHIFNWW